MALLQYLSMLQSMEIPIKWLKLEKTIVTVVTKTTMRTSQSSDLPREIVNSSLIFISFIFFPLEMLIGGTRIL